MFYDLIIKNRCPFFLGLFVIAVTLTAVGCTQKKISRNAGLINGLEQGVSYTQVVETLGEPLKQENISATRFVAFYQTVPGDAAGMIDSSSLCMPIGFEENKVAGVGNDLYDKWCREEEERARRIAIYKARRNTDQLIEAARLRRVAQRNKKIAALEKEVAPVPASNAELNLKLYQELLTLDPRNTRYQKKVSYYENRVDKQKKAAQIRAEKKTKEKLRLAWEENRQARNQLLGEYDGNGIAEMAVYDMGNHSIYVWVKNVSQQIITTHPDYFSLLDDNKKTIPCVIDDSLDCVLEPGSLSHGEIAYHPDCIPNELIFQNNESGRVSKVFQ